MGPMLCPMMQPVGGAGDQPYTKCQNTTRNTCEQLNCLSTKVRPSLCIELKGQLLLTTYEENHLCDKGLVTCMFVLATRKLSRLAFHSEYNATLYAAYIL